MSAPEPRSSIVRITHLGRMGDGVVVAAGAPPVYVRGALPGERVRVGATFADRKIVRAPLLEVVEPSVERKRVACEVAEVCGGCPFAHVVRDAQVSAKERWLRDALRAQRTPSLSSELPIERVVPAPETGYRTRARFAWGGGSLGYRIAQRVEIVSLSRCPVLVPALEDVRAQVFEALAGRFVGDGELRLSLSLTPGGDAETAVVALEAKVAQPPSFHRAVAGLVERGVLAGAVVDVPGAPARIVGDPMERSRDVDGRLLEVEAGAFRQAHVAARAELGSRVIRFADPEAEDVLELHAGHGHFSLALAARARSLVAVELEGRAVRQLRANAERHGITLDARVGDAAEELVRALRGPEAPSVLVIDPPRVGAVDVVEAVPRVPSQRAGLRRVVYVSCDLATFARDAAKLAAAGFALRELALVDLFPDTLHAELVARFDRA